MKPGTSHRIGDAHAFCIDPKCSSGFEITFWPGIKEPSHNCAVSRRRGRKEGSRFNFILLNGCKRS
jgi:hypothetical protein